MATPNEWGDELAQTMKSVRIGTVDWTPHRATGKLCVPMDTYCAPGKFTGGQWEPWAALEADASPLN